VGVNDAEIMTGLSRWTWRYGLPGACCIVKAGRRLLIPVAEIRRVIAEGTARAWRTMKALSVGEGHSARLQVAGAPAGRAAVNMTGRSSNLRASGDHHQVA
jgi:hypothetical protein